ncbi:hypothetical protein HII31_13438 [Pseudocercospora fuligena]|uniref:Uncharacterized protein n=1 Tax=Pseudocercospora fuligena TaxID=685502 RepID=A0A8H6R5Y4_9PEZI|nr:hypothetical protein HII31_13438 [Pseudocercospora fuligena]
MEPGKFFWTIEANAMVPDGTQLAEILLKNHVPTPLGFLGTKARLRLSMKKFKGEVYTSGVTSRSGRGMKGMENDLQLMRRSVHLVEPNTDLGQLDPPGLHKPLVLQRGYVKKNSILKVDIKPVETTAWVKASNVKLDLEELCAVIRIHEEANDISDLANSANNDLYSSRVQDKKDEIDRWWFQMHARSNANHRGQRPEHLDDAVSGQRDRSRDRGRDRSTNGSRSRSFSPSRGRTISPPRGDGHYQRDLGRAEHSQRGQDDRHDTSMYHDQAYTSGYKDRHDRDSSEREPQTFQRHRAPYHQRSPSPVANPTGYGARRDWNDHVHPFQPYDTKAFDQTYHLPGSRPFSRVPNNHAGNGNHGQYVNDPTKLQGQNQNSEPDPEISNAGLENSGGSDRLSAKRALDAQEGEERSRKRRKDKNTTEAPLNARECAKANGTAPLQAHSSDYKRTTDYEALESAQQRRQGQGPMTNLAEDMGDTQL